MTETWRERDILGSVCDELRDEVERLRAVAEAAKAFVDWHTQPADYGDVDLTKWKLYPELRRALDGWQAGTAASS